MSLLAKIKRSLTGGASESAPASAESSSELEGSKESVAATLARPASSAEGEILDVLRSKVSEFSNGQLAARDVDPRAILFDFGYVDSLTAVTLISFIDTEYGVSISELDLVGALNHLQAVADHIERRRAT